MENKLEEKHKKGERKNLPTEKTPKNPPRECYTVKNEGYKMVFPVAY